MHIYCVKCKKSRTFMVTKLSKSCWSNSQSCWSNSQSCLALCKHSRRAAGNINLWAEGVNLIGRSILTSKVLTVLVARLIVKILPRYDLSQEFSLLEPQLGRQVQFHNTQIHNKQTYDFSLTKPHIQLIDIYVSETTF